MAVVIGLTGGIGSGKTYRARRLEAMGAPVYYSDAAAKRLINEDAQLQQQISALLGTDVFKDGIYQTQLVASRVFADQSLLQQLNQIVHPAVIEDAMRWIENHQHEKLLVIESALLFESGLDSLCDQVVCITAPEDLCIERVMARDGVSKAQVRERMSKQMPDEERQQRSDLIFSSKET